MENSWECPWDIYGVLDAISVEMTELRKKTQFYVALFRRFFFFFDIFLNPWRRFPEVFRSRKKCHLTVTCSNVQVDNCKQPDLESPCLKPSNGMCLQNFLREREGLHSLAHGL